MIGLFFLFALFFNISGLNRIFSDIEESIFVPDGPELP